MKHKHDQSGFTLIEVLIAITIFAIGILALATIQISSLKGNSKSARLTEAITLAELHSERLISLTWSHPDLADTDGDGIEDNGGSFGLDDNTLETSDHTDTSNEVYSIFWNIAVDQIIKNTKTVNVIVTWEDNYVNLQRVISK